MKPLRAFYELLDQSQWWPGDRLLEWQHSQLTPLLHHARSTVPFYRFRLNKVYRSNGTIDWERWHEIPILTREDVSQHFKTLRSRAPIRQHGPFQDVSSSGSTGHPVTIVTTRWLNDMTIACNWRAQRWAGLDWSKPLLMRGNSIEGKPVGAALGPWGPPWDPQAARGRQVYTNYSNSYGSDLELIQQAPVYAYAATTNQLELFFDNPHLPRLDDLKAVLPRGGAVSDFLRLQVARFSDARVIETYSSKEGGSLAHPCPSGHGYHTNAEATLVEIVDGDGMPVATGEKGRVVITPFGATAMPLIRYDQGDEAVAGGECQCGRFLPSIRHLEGRTNAVFTHPDGRRSREMMPLEARKLLGAGRWQVRQVGPKDFEVDYVIHDWGTPPDLPAFEAMFRFVFFDDAAVTVRQVEDMQFGKTGKYLEYVNQWAQGSAH